MHPFKVILIGVLSLVAMVPIFGAAAVVDLGACLKPTVLIYRATGQHPIRHRCRALVKALAPGDEVVFSDGARFTLGERVRAGGSAVVWRLANEPKWAVRIPLSEGYIVYMDWFKMGWRQLQEWGVPVIALRDPSSTTLEYEVVEYFPMKLVFTEMVDRLARARRAQRTTRSPIVRAGLNALNEFAEQTAQVAVMLDQPQAGFDGEHWRMFDFAKVNFLFTDMDGEQSLFVTTLWKPYVYADDYFNDLHFRTLQWRMQGVNPACRAALRR